MKSFFLTFAIALLTLSCKKEQLPIASKVIIIAKDSVKVIDTILAIDSLNFTDSNGSRKLTEAIAQKVLDGYYAAKGIHNYKTGYQDDEGNQMCAYYDTLYRYHLNNDNHEDGIIEYHLMPCLASGHCYLPSYAIITKINGKYQLIAPQFLPNHFGLDTIVSDRDFNYLYFYKIDCGKDTIVDRYKSKIKRY